MRAAYLSNDLVYMLVYPFVRDMGFLTGSTTLFEKWGFGCVLNHQFYMRLEVLDVSNFESLAFFQGLDKVGGIQHGVKGAGVQPGEAALHDLDLQGVLS